MTGQEVSSQQTQIYWCLDLGLPASRTMRNKCLLFIIHLVCDIIIIAAQWTKTYVYVAQTKVLFSCEVGCLEGMGWLRSPGWYPRVDDCKAGLRWNCVLEHLHVVILEYQDFLNDGLVFPRGCSRGGAVVDTHLLRPVYEKGTVSLVTFFQSNYSCKPAQIQEEETPSGVCDHFNQLYMSAYLVLEILYLYGLSNLFAPFISTAASLLRFS